MCEAGEFELCCHVVVNEINSIRSMIIQFLNIYYIVLITADVDVSFSYPALVLLSVSVCLFLLFCFVLFCFALFCFVQFYWHSKYLYLLFYVSLHWNPKA